MSEPTPVEDLDSRVGPAIRGYQRARWWLGVVLSAIALLAIAILSGVVIHQNQLLKHANQTIARQEAEIRSACDFYAPLLAIPLEPTPPAVRPSELGVKIVIGARVAFKGEHCGKLPPAPRSLLHWARFYHLTVPVD